jgi:predicted Zn-dependent protease
MHMLLRVCLFGLLFLLISCGRMEARLAKSSEADCGYVVNAFGYRVSWKSNVPVTLMISKSWPDKHLKAVQRAVAQWNDSTGRELLRIAREKAGDRPARDSRNGLHWMNEWSSARTTEQAQTTMYYTGNRPYEADIKINAKNFEYFDDDWSEGGQYHLESLLIHEIGHLLGLAHASSPRTVMSPFLYAYDRRVDITSNELGAIKCEYRK